MKGIVARTAFFGIDSSGKPGPVKKENENSPREANEPFPGGVPVHE